MSAAKQSSSPLRNLISGAIWTVATRWIIKSIGFINTVIMARLLLPEDYGLVAMAMLFSGLIQAFVDFNTYLYLIRKKEVTEEEVNSAWTSRLIQGSVMSLLLATTAPLAALFFEEPRLTEIVWILAGCLFVSGFANVGPILAFKQFNYAIDFKIQIISKVSGALGTIVSGYFLRDYHALVIGIAIGYLMPLALSYLLHPYRPKICLSKFMEIWDFGKWLLLERVGGFILMKSDELIAAKIGSAHEYGIYNVGADLGQLPVGEIGPAMQRAFLPVLADIADDTERVNRAVLKTFAAVAAIVLPVGLGFAAIDQLATRVILGDKWLEASQFIALFSLVAILDSTNGPFQTLLTLRQKIKLQSSIMWLEFFVFLAASALLVPQVGLIGLAYGRLAGGLSSWIAFAWSARHYCGITFSNIAQSCYRPALLSVGMYGLVHFLPLSDFSPLPALAISIAVGAIAYTTLIILSWQWAGRPEGLEHMVWQRLAPFLRRLKKSGQIPPAA